MDGAGLVMPVGADTIRDAPAAIPQLAVISTRDNSPLDARVRKKVEANRRQVEVEVEAIDRDGENIGTNDSRPASKTTVGFQHYLARKRGEDVEINLCVMHRAASVVADRRQPAAAAAVRARTAPAESIT